MILAEGRPSSVGEEWLQGNCECGHGAGKTVFALAAMEMMKQKYTTLQVRVVVPTIPLARQWKESLLHHAESEKWQPGFLAEGSRMTPGAE